MRSCAVGIERKARSTRSVLSKRREWDAADPLYSTMSCRGAAVTSEELDSQQPPCKPNRNNVPHRNMILSDRASVSKTLEVLEQLAESPAGLSVAEVSDVHGLPKSVAHRLLARLVERNYVHQDPDTARYKLSLWLPMLGFKYLAARGISEVWQPILDELAAKSGEYVALAVAENSNLIWVANARGARAALRFEPFLGPVVRLNNTASGLAWLATLPENEAVEIMVRHGFEQPTVPENYGKNAARSVSEMLERIAEVHEQGYALALESGEPGLHVIAVSIPARAEGACGVGTLSIAGPAFRLPVERLQKLYPLLKDAAQTLSEIWPLRPTGHIRSRVLEATRMGKIEGLR
ncbi:IclR family transcriptional regulator [Undibacter mobilis]|uniref:IclR family transcriptional regulator n=2 Tax=Undibacter mobilis TaxID=2292256 RepID=A0A371B9N8_9BRAD|nr:IclR family transcriptional regulator [Undibacter mobilis]